MAYAFQLWGGDSRVVTFLDQVANKSQILTHSSPGGHHSS